MLITPSGAGGAAVTIVSISMNDEDLENIDLIRREYDLKGRSDAVRVALRKAAADLEEVRDLEGQVEGVLIAVRSDHADPWLNIIQSRYVSVVTTQMHSHLKDRRCLEVMVLSGSAEDVRSMLLDVEASGKAEYVRFVRRRGRTYSVGSF